MIGLADLRALDLRTSLLRAALRSGWRARQPGEAAAPCPAGWGVRGCTDRSQGVRLMRSPTFDLRRYIAFPVILTVTRASTITPRYFTRLRASSAVPSKLVWQDARSQRI